MGFCSLVLESVGSFGNHLATVLACSNAKTETEDSGSTDVEDTDTSDTTDTEDTSVEDPDTDIENLD